MATITATTSVDHITYRTDVAAEATDELLQQFQGSPNIVKLVTIIATMKQAIDTATVQLGKLRLIANATGDFLDEIGEELGVDRDGLEDSDYRILLQIRGYKTKSQGTRPDIIDLISRMTGVEEKSIVTYIGKQKTVDIAFHQGCLDAEGSTSPIEDILPILTNYRLVSLTGTPIGFKSVNDTSDPTNMLGFGSVFDSNVVWGIGGGHLGGLLSTTERGETSDI